MSLLTASQSPRYQQVRAAGSLGYRIKRLHSYFALGYRSGMATFAAFTRAVFAHWEVLVSGVIFNGLLFASGIVASQQFGRDVPWQTYPVAFTLFLFIACFMAWKDEYRKRQQLEQVRPRFRLELVRQAFGNVGNNLLGIQTIIGIRNIGTMQSVAGGWRISLTDASGIAIPVEQMYFPGRVTLEHADGREVIEEADLIDRKTVSKPIEVGTYVQGLLYGGIKGMQPEDVKPGYTLTVQCVDVFDVPYTAAFTIPENRPAYQHMREPGIETQRFESAKSEIQTNIGASAEEKVEHSLKQQPNWTVERLLPTPTEDFAFLVKDKLDVRVLVFKLRDTNRVNLYSFFIMPPEPLKHVDALTEDQRRELSNEIRKTMIDAHMSHFAIEEQPFRKFVFADEIKIDSLTEMMSAT